MKWLSIILAFFILYISCMPCQDMHETDHITKGSSTLTQSIVDHQQDHDKSAEHCSPFCMCACCGQAYSAFSQQVILASPELPFDQLLCKILVGDAKGISSDFWQPPRNS